jgi:hypothetical protein
VSQPRVIAPASRRIRARPLTPGESAGGLIATGLPPDLLQDSARRLGFVGLLFAAGNAMGLAIEEALRAIGVMSQEMRLARDGAEVLGMVLGLGVRLLSQRGDWSPAKLIAAGLVFEVVGGYLTVFPEALSLVVYKQGAESIGVSWLAVWIAVYPIVLPASPTVAVLAALITASMAPLAVWTATLLGYPWPHAAKQIFFFVPCYSMAVLTVMPAMLLHRMRREVSEARALGSYRLEERLGGGAMGEVWRASHRMLARPAAIKVIGSSVTAGATPQEFEMLQQRFELEAQATASLSSPHTVALYDFGVTEDGQFFYVMELLEGLDFERLVKDHGAVPPERVVHLLAQACESLDEAHGRGLVHRDIKPSNLYACRIGGRDDFVKVLDFGLVMDPATPRTRDVRLTAGDMAIGTPSTMAPEVVLGGATDARADLYALGCVGYWLTAGRDVFETRSAVELMSHHAHQTPDPPSRHTKTVVPYELDALLLACLEKDPARRPQSAAELSHRLASVPLVRPWTSERAAEWWRSKGKS